ncbi:MAG: HEAT repeat domain-containing protein, partial [Candidatus Poribacteria bacterium]|nr:HEAT repeat domain-containing protein [Candidatus Poribacteria bacterium]
MADKPYQFSDEDMRRFIVNGHVTLKPDFPRSFHEHIYQQTKLIFESDGNPGNNLLPRIPEIQEVFDHVAVRDALSGILGPDYIMHSHRHPHHNLPGSAEQNFHKDSYWGYDKVRHHCPHWVLAFYYPQDVVEAIGPSAVLPGTQYYNTQLHEDGAEGTPLYGEAGTVTLLHFDLWHRAMANQTQKHRFMMKFEFVRMKSPAVAPWQPETPNWKTVGWEAPLGNHEAMWRHIWDWLRGQKSSSNGDSSSMNGEISELGNQLHGCSEVASLDAAYALGAVDDVSDTLAPMLIDALSADSELTRRSAAYGLGAVGKAAVPALIDALSQSSESIRRNAVYALAQMDLSAREAVPALSKALRDPCVQVRRHAAETLGSVGESAQNAVPALIDALQDSDDHVRFDSALALAQIGKPAGDAVPALVTALKDENRYVRFNASVALEWIGTPEAIDAL